MSKSTNRIERGATVVMCCLAIITIAFWLQIVFGIIGFTNGAIWNTIVYLIAAGILSIIAIGKNEEMRALKSIGIFATECLIIIIPYLIILLIKR